MAYPDNSKTYGGGPRMAGLVWTGLANPLQRTQSGGSEVQTDQF